MSGLRQLVLTAFLSICLGGCALLPPDQARWSRHEIYFGEVPAAQWDQFVEDTITPEFPDGFTVVEAAGQWREASGRIIRERSHLLMIIAQDPAGTHAKLQKISDQFKARFGEETVLMVQSAVQVEFR